jgi:hypothetical protein
MYVLTKEKQIAAIAALAEGNSIRSIERMTEKCILALQDAIQHTHGCGSRHVETVPVRETFQGKTVWDGSVEVFDLIGHPKANQGYAWGFQDDAGKWQ